MLPYDVINARCSVIKQTKQFEEGQINYLLSMKHELVFKNSPLSALSRREVRFS